MAKPYIALALGSLSLTLDTFTSAEYPRIRIQNGELERTANNALVIVGRAYEQPHLWDFTALIKPPQRDQLLVLYAEQQRLIRTYSATYPILLTDTTQPYQEIAPRTRGKAPSPFGTESEPYTGFVSYFAQYYAVFAAPPALTQEGNRIQAQIQLQELEAKVAA